jgi:hypothetical protein
VSTHLNRIKTTLEEGFKQKDFENTVLFKSSCYNNSIKNFNTNLINSFREREYGTPEIVLIPLDIHNPELNNEKYSSMYNDFLNKIKRKKNDINSELFVFKHLMSADGKKCTEVIKKIQEFIETNKNYFGHSLQCYPLLTVLKRDVNPELISNGFVKNIGENIDPSEIKFMNSYNEEPTSKCAFETFGYYKSIESLFDNISGGRVGISDDIVVQTTTDLTTNYKQPNNDYPKNNYEIENENIYYSEFCSIPFLASEYTIIGGKKLTKKNKISKKINKQYKKPNKLMKITKKRSNK